MSCSEISDFLSALVDNLHVPFHKFTRRLDGIDVLFVGNGKEICSYKVRFQFWEKTFAFWPDVPMYCEFLGRAENLTGKTLSGLKVRFDMHEFSRPSAVVKDLVPMIRAATSIFSTINKLEHKHVLKLERASN